MAKGFPIYSDLIIKLDPKNVNMVQAQLKQTLSSGSVSVDIAKPIGLREYEDALKRVRRESTGLIGDMQSLGERSTRVFARFSAYLLASGGILASISLMKDAVGQALKFNSELIRIKQVSGDSSATIGKLADEVGRLSKNLGVSSSELIKSAVTLKQAGLSVKETTKALETLAQADLAPNFDSMAKTTEGLIAIYQQFGKNIDKVKTQLGSLNAIAGEFATEASDLITVVQKTGGAAASSGASLEQLLALFTSVRATTRESADSIATGLRTIFGRLQRPETIKFLDELGIKMRYTAEEAKAAGKNVGDFVGPFEAILRISAGTANMGTGSTLFSNLVEQIGGLRQISRVVPLIKESALAVEAWNVALAGQNSLYINSLQKQDDYLIKLKKIQEMFLEMGRNLVSSKGFENLVAVLGSMAKAAIQVTDALGPLLPYLAQLLVLNTAMGAVKSVSRGVLTSVGYLPAQSQKKMATGGIVPGSGRGDKVPALLEPGEAVIPVKSVQKYSSIIPELIKGNLPRFSDGYMPSVRKVGLVPNSRKDRVASVYDEIMQSQPLDRKSYGVENILLHDAYKFGTTASYDFQNRTVNVYPDAFSNNYFGYHKKKSLRQILGHELAHGLDNTLPTLLGGSGINFNQKGIARFTGAVSFGNGGFYKVRKPEGASFLDEREAMLYPHRATDAPLLSSRISQQSYNKLLSKDSQFSGYIKHVNDGMIKKIGVPIFDENGQFTKEANEYYEKNSHKLTQDDRFAIRKATEHSAYLRSTSELFARTVGEKFLSRGKGILGVLERLGIPKGTLARHNLLKMATGGIVPGSGSGDKTPALLEPGEAVIPKSQVSKFPSFINQLISGGVKGFADGYMPKIIGGTPDQKKMLEKVLKDILEKSGITTGVKRVFITDKFKDKEGKNNLVGQHDATTDKVRLNPSIFSSEASLRKTLGHELAHDLDKQMNYPSMSHEAKVNFLKNDPKYRSAVKKNDARYLEYLERDEEIFARMIGEQDLARSKRPDSKLKELGISDDDIKKGVRPKGSNSLFSKFGDFAKRIGSALVTQKPVPDAPGFTPLNQGLTGALSGILPPPPPPPPPSKPMSLILKDKLSMNKIRTNADEIKDDPTLGGLLKSSPKSSKKAERYYDALAVRELDKDSGNSALKKILQLKEKEKSLATEIDKLEQGRRIGREIFPKHFRGDTSNRKNYDFSMYPPEAEPYLRDKGAYLENLRNKQKELSTIKQTLSEPNPFARVGNLYLPNSSMDMNSVRANVDKGWGGTSLDVSANNPYLSSPPSGNRVPFTPGGTGYANVPRPPSGYVPFTPGGGEPPDNPPSRGGRGGGGKKRGGGKRGGGGGGGPPNDPPNIPLERVAEDFKTEKSYGGLSSLFGIGVPIALGAGAAFQKDEETQSRLGTASVFSGIGGQLGSLGGPLGTIVGTAIGGIVGWFVGGAEAVKDAAKKLQAKKLDESVEKLNLALEDLSEGRGSIGKLAESLSEVRKNAFKNAKENLKPGEDLFQKSQEEFQKIAGINLAKSQAQINEQLKKQAKAGQGPLLQGEFNDVAKEIVEMRQRKGERFTMQDYEKQLKETYNAYAADKARKDADIRFVQQIDASVHSAKSFADAVQKAADAATEMDKSIATLTNGGYATPSLRLGEYGNINQGNLSALSSFGGGMFSGLTSQVSGANQVSKYLPEVLSRIIKPGEGSNTDTSVSGAFEEAFNNIAKQTGEKFDKKVLSVLSNKLESMKTEDLFENFKKAPEQFADEMIKSFEPALKALESIGKNLQTRDEAYQRGLSQLKEMNNRRNELFAQRNSISLGLTDISDEMFNNRAGITGQSPRFANARNAFVSEQQRLAPGLDINTIGDAISQEKDNLRILQEKASEEARAASGSKVFADKVLESENRLNNLNKALSNLTNRSEELSRLQARRSTLESRIEAKLELNRAFYSADRQGLLQMNRNFGAARALTAFGPDKIRQKFGIDFGADVFQRGMSALEGPLANVVLQTRRVKDDRTGEVKDIEYTGKMLARENLLKALGPGAKIKEETDEISKILQEITSITSDSKTAVDIMIRDLNNSKKELYDKLQINNKSFTDNLNKLINELSNNARVAETAKDRTRLNEIEPQLKAADELQKSGLDADAVRKNIRQIREAKAAQAEYDNVSANAEQNAASAEFYIKERFGKESPDSIAAGTAQFGYTADERRKIAMGLEGMLKLQGNNNPEIAKLRKAKQQSRDPVEWLRIDKQIEEEQNRKAEITPEFSARLREIQVETAQRAKLEKERKVAPNLLPATKLSDSALKFAESQGDMQKIQKENLDLQKRINENQNIIRQFEANRNKANEQGGQKQPVQAPVPFMEAPRPQFRTIKENKFAGQEFGANFDKTFTDFNANFGKQVEALAAIPKVIEMNVKQTVEVIVNGAGAMAMLEPTMKKVADAAVVKGIETIGGQLRAANIKINYDPNADGGVA